jgi:hypothetical protein
MLQTAMGGPAATAPVEEVLDLATAPGLDADSAAQLEAAGFGTLEAIAEAGADALAEVPAVGTLDRAQAIYDWAKEQLDLGEKRRAAEIGSGLSLPKKSDSSMGDEDFMAALSRAFQESEAQRAGVAKPDEENPAAAGGEPAAESEEP